MSDLISRDLVLHGIAELIQSPWYNQGKDCEYHGQYLTRKEAVDVVKVLCVEKAPAVDAAPVVHGRWVKLTGMMPPEYHGHYECSECQWHMKGLRNSWTREEELSYCPNCGAKMDGGEANDTD